MGLDIYAGTLTRYYAQNWKTVVQQWAEENGYDFRRITAEGGEPPQETLSPEEVQAAVSSWRDQLLAAIPGPDGTPYAPWEENNEKPYYTDKPDWDAFGALLLYAAARVYGEPAPPTVEKNWDFQEHPLVKRAMEDGEKNWSLFVGATWWLPIRDCFYLRGPNPAGAEIVISTAGSLLAELSRINELGWQADEETILRWASTEGYPVDGTVEADKSLTWGAEHTVYETESLAKFACSILWQAAKYSLEHQVPILMDF